MRRDKYSVLYTLHVMPNEIYELGRIVEIIEKSTFNNPNVDVTIYVDLNLSDEYTNWDESILKRDFIESILNSQIDKSRRNLNIISNVKVTGHWGVNATRRSVIREFKDTFDYISFIDCDIMFSDDAMDYVYETLEKVEGEFLIFSGMLPKMWNANFSELVHPTYKDHDNKNTHSKVDPLTINRFHKKQKNRIGFTDEVVIGGGWFNVFSTTIFDYVDIPDELGVYGIDDHWIQECCKFLNKNGWDIKQCYNTKFIVFENHGRKFEFDPKYLVDNDKLTKKFMYEKNAKNMERELWGKFVKDTLKKYF